MNRFKVGMDIYDVKHVIIVEKDWEASKMRSEVMWQDFCRRQGLATDTPYEAFSFGGPGSAIADPLAQLVMAGKKTATCSAKLLYEVEDEPLPEVGSYSVILDSRNQAQCVIQTTGVVTIPYEEVTEAWARKEGEGDLSLEYWRQAHWSFFEAEFRLVGQVFTPDQELVFEEFQLVYRLPEASLG